MAATALVDVVNVDAELEDSNAENALLTMEEAHGVDFRSQGSSRDVSATPVPAEPPRGGRQRPPKLLDSESSTSPRKDAGMVGASSARATVEVASSGGTPAESAASTNELPTTMLSSEQQFAFEMVVKEHRSIFLTGGAGTGKSHLIRQMIAALPLTTTFVTATTGIAALNLCGSTLHSFVGCGIVHEGLKRNVILQNVMRKKRAVRNWRSCRVLIIDEISMLDAAFFELVDYIARHVRNRPTEPFGGIQLILSGDFLQLPPVTKRGTLHAPGFCFETPTWIDVNPLVCVLSMPFRQRNHTFFKILSQMRCGELQTEAVAVLQSLNTSNAVNFAHGQTQPQQVMSMKRERSDMSGVKSEEPDGASAAPPRGQNLRQTHFVVTNGDGVPLDAPFDGYTILRSTKAEVEQQNTRYYNLLHTEIFYYHCSFTGEGQSQGSQVPELVSVREGCRVMLIKNIDPRLGLVNGSVGTVTGFVSFGKGYVFRSTATTSMDARAVCRGRGKTPHAPHTMLPVVKFDLRLPSGAMASREIVIEPQEWTEMQGDRVIARWVQLPLILAYAITIHKSQGMSLTQVDIDFDRIFETGQAYVALSRCTDLDGVRLHGFGPHVVSPNKVALSYYKALELFLKRRAWQHAHTPDVIERQAATEALCCTPYGYERPSQSESSDRSPDFRHAKEEMTGGGLLVPSPSEDGTAANDSARLEQLRRCITPLLEMATEVQRLVVRFSTPAHHIQNARLIMDVGALSGIMMGNESTSAFDYLFGEARGNMMRIPLCVEALLHEAAAYRSTSASTSATTSHDTSKEEPVLAASDIAAEVLVMMEKAKRDFFLDIQRPEQRAALPTPSEKWQRYAEILPLLHSTAPSEAPTAPAVSESVEYDAPATAAGADELQASSLEDRVDAQEIAFLWNQDPREALHHRAILQYSQYLKTAYGDNTIICSDSISLRACAMAFNMMTTSVDALLRASRS